MAVGIAVVMHLLLFVAAGPTENGSMPEMASVQPYTHYSLPAKDGDMDEAVIRAVESPVVFSLPSALGFSREMLGCEVHTSKSFQQPVRNEQFLDVEPSVRGLNKTPDFSQLMVTAVDRTPKPPALTVGVERPFPASSRVMIPPELENRLVGELVLPAEMNRPAETPWLVHASISISKEGMVTHVLFDQPLEPESLNNLALRWFYRLRFTAGAALESSIEIYSPESHEDGDEER